MHQVGFAKSHASVDEKRVVNLTRRFRHGQGGCMGQVIVGAYHKGIKGVL